LWTLPNFTKQTCDGTPVALLNLWIQNKGSMMQDEIFITGATGNIGVEIVKHLLKNSRANLTLLIRAANSSAGLDRITESLYAIDPSFSPEKYYDRIKILNGDITLAGLGLDSNIYCNLAERTTHIIHCAASTKFNQPLESARNVNLNGTHNVLKFAERSWRAGSLRKIAIMSTAFVCGNVSGHIPESITPVMPPFSNSYEQTKWESENLILNDFAHMPIDILRPSIVIGNSRNGRIREINVLYIPLKLILQGIVKSLPANPKNALDIVPVDYVARATAQILFNAEESDGIKIYHICAGEMNSPTIDKIIKLALRCLSGDIEKYPKYITEYNNNKSELNNFKNSDRINELIHCYEPYLNHQRNFGITNLQKALKSSRIQLPKFTDYFGRTLEYAMQTKWGRNIKPAA
jgi:thioester reductase-like protein